MSVATLKSIALPSLLSGLRGGALPSISGIATDLHVLALTAQALRFDRPAPPESFNGEETTADARTVVPDAVREPMIRLVAEKRDSAGRDVLLKALAASMAANRFRLHPFDLALLDPFVEAFATELGAEALAYSQRNVKAERKQSYFALDSISDETWMLGNRGEKAKYIARRRTEDPVIARQLVEHSWENQDVDSRVRLAGALRVAVSGDDKEFFTRLLKDRSPRVRDVARGVLVRLPDFEGDEGHLKTIRDRIRVKEYGLPLMRRRKEMRLDLPASVGYHGAFDWVQENFGKIGIEEFVSAFGMPLDDVLKAASCDQNMIHGLLVMAVCSGDAVTAGRLVNEVLKDDGSSFFLIDSAIYDHLTETERHALVAAVVRPEKWSDFPLNAMERLHGLIDGYLPDEIARRFLSSQAWRPMDEFGRHTSADALSYLAVMCPPALRDLLRSRFAPFDHRWTSRAILFFEIIEHLETKND
ncbi:hypothetical protein HFN89_01705 [Rhizobium laguerreae]|nr:hypothetical protein [Rhizobium laguerreae]